MHNRADVNSLLQSFLPCLHFSEHLSRDFRIRGHLLHSVDLAMNPALHLGIILLRAPHQ